MPAKPPYNRELFDPFIERVAGRTAALVLGALKPEFLRPEPQPVAAAPDELLNKQAVVGHNNGPDDDAVVRTVDEFCARNKISKSNLYKQWKLGRGPKYFKVGKATRITGRAERQWQLASENAAAAAPCQLESSVGG